MPISSVGRANKTRGVTLIEMLVVITIIGLISAVALPSITAGIDSVRLRTASDSIAGFLNAAVNRAERLQQAIVVVISPKDNCLTLYSNEPGFTRELRMPSGVTIEAVLPKLPGGISTRANNLCYHKNMGIAPALWDFPGANPLNSEAGSGSVRNFSSCRSRLPGKCAANEAPGSKSCCPGN